MAAEIKPNVDDNRQKLADIIPLPAPFTVYIEQTRYCNLKCFYCIHSTRDDENGDFKRLGYELKHMPEEDYLKVIHDLQEFPQGTIKRIVFSGLGEPTANPLLPKFVKIAVDSKISDRVEVITNGLLLNEKMIDELIETKLTNINISIQGLTSEKYEKICGKKIDYEKFLTTLQYLYKNKKNTRIYIKIIDEALDNKEDEKVFYERFSPMADRIYVEHMTQMQQSHNSIKDKVDGTRNFYGQPVNGHRQVCAPAFYYLQVGCDLNIFPCPLPGLTKNIVIGNAKQNSLKEIWNGQRRKNILKNLLKFQKDKIIDCRECTCYDAVNDPNEYLDDAAEEILERI